MKGLHRILLIAGVLPVLATSAYRRIHRATLPGEYVQELDDPCGYVERIPKRLPYYRAPAVRTSAYGSYYDYPTYDTFGSLNCLGAPHHGLGGPPCSKGLAGSICTPLGTTLKGQIGCGGVQGSIISPFGAAISGSIGHIPTAEPCRLCSHDVTAAHYL